ncbi:hypothetical protein B566_EDAN004579 [Ephemera danica]|nr:hypothetical protein B566_EDAN004579 [Ephemera danica]
MRSSCSPVVVMVVHVSLLVLLVSVAALSEGASNEHHDWGYGKRNGPRSWTGVCSTGSFQSPIDLSLFTAHPRHFEPLVFFAYNMAANATITNNGHTVSLTMRQPCTAQIAGGGLPGALPLEAHFVHYDSRRFKSVKEAVGQEDGLAVIGVMYRETNEPNPAISRLLNGVSGVIHTGSEMMLPGGLQLDRLLPRDTETFFRYRGSLTTPGCNEGVLWTVLTSYAPIAKEQFKELKSHGGKLELNYRPVQPLNERVVYVRAEGSAAGLSALGLWVLLGVCSLLVKA